MMRYQLLVFDWDGTLADSLGHIVDTLQAVTKQLQLPELPAERIRNIIGLGLDEGMEVLYPSIPQADREQLTDLYKKQFRLNTDNVSVLYPDVAITLKALHQQGYLLALATGKSRRGLDRALQDSNLSDYFHLTRSADEALSKPHPQMLEDIMAILDVDTGATLMIGDTEFDLQMAINAGVASVAVKYGAHDVQRLLEFNPLQCFDSLKELPAWLRSDGMAETIV